MVDVIIPSYRPDEKFKTLIKSLNSQTVRPSKIIIENTEKKYLDDFLAGGSMEEYGSNIVVENIALEDFDHGATRNAGAVKATGEYVLFMTQDAYPADDKLIESMLEAIKQDEDIVSVYARQLAADDAPLAEKYSRQFNYPDKPHVKSKDDMSRLGIKTFFCSNACAMYRRNVFMELGMFPQDMIFNEDMVFARRVIDAGYKICYASEAKVIHSHRYTNMQQFRRNFDLGVSQAMHKDVFENVSSEAEGGSYAKNALKYFCKLGRPLYFIPFAITCVYRLAGYKLGKNYEKLSHGLILKCTMSPLYFEKHWRKA